MGGFTILELLIAMGITMTVMASTFGLLHPAQGMFSAQPDAADMQQRLRVGVDALSRDLMMAGAGIDSGPMAGPLGHYVAPVLPYRIGASGADPPGRYFSDRITVLYVPATSAQTRTLNSVMSTSPTTAVSTGPGCPLGDAGCGFDKGMGALVMDTETGAWDAFTVRDVSGATLQLQHRGGQLSAAYAAGSVISEIAMFTYWLKADTASRTYQLMRYDGNQSDVPVADNIVGLAFEYFAEPLPGAADLRLVKVLAGELTDGPWRPDAASPGRYDADLLRVRSIRVTLRVQAANASNRGPTGSLFARGGTSTGGERYVPDQQITFDVTPRNLGR